MNQFCDLTLVDEARSIRTVGDDPADELLIGAIRRGGEAGDDAAPGWFCDFFALPSQREMTKSTPTMARNCLSTNDSGESSTDHGCCCRAS